MTTNVLVVDPTKCTGCRDCEVACSKKHTYENNPDLSRIHILDLDNSDDFHLPTTCLYRALVLFHNINRLNNNTIFVGNYSLHNSPRASLIACDYFDGVTLFYPKHRHLTP